MPKLEHDDNPDLTRTTAPQGIPARRTKSETMPAPQHPASARLVCVAGVDRGRSFPVGTAPLVIGWGSTEATGLRANDISRQHARIQIRGGEITIEDLGSRNGTFVDGELIASVVPIHVGSRVQLGESTILVLTQHDALEASMRQLQKLEAMERVVGGLAHDFNNVLTVVCAGLDYALDLPPANDTELREVLDDLKNATMGGAALAKRLMHFRQREESLSQDIIVLAFVVGEALALARHTMDSSIALAIDVSPELVVRGSRDALQQVFLNLAFNARDAMPAGGTLSISARAVRFARAEATTHQLAEGGVYVELVFADSGSGMSEATLTRAFEPFFTTKPAEQGTGLGLSMVHSIIRRHGGAIEAESEVGKGTRFRNWLPMVP